MFRSQMHDDKGENSHLSQLRGLREKINTFSPSIPLLSRAFTLFIFLGFESWKEIPVIVKHSRTVKVESLISPHFFSYNLISV